MIPDRKLHRLRLTLEAALGILPPQDTRRRLIEEVMDSEVMESHDFADLLTALTDAHDLWVRRGEQEAFR